MTSQSTGTTTFGAPSNLATRPNVLGGNSRPNVPAPKQTRSAGVGGARTEAEAVEAVDLAAADYLAPEDYLVPAGSLVPGDHLCPAVPGPP